MLLQIPLSYKEGIVLYGQIYVKNSKNSNSQRLVILRFTGMFPGERFMTIRSGDVEHIYVRAAW